MNVTYYRIGKLINILPSLIREGQLVEMGISIRAVPTHPGGNGNRKKFQIMLRTVELCGRRGIEVSISCTYEMVVAYSLLYQLLDQIRRENKLAIVAVHSSEVLYQFPKRQKKKYNRKGVSYNKLDIGQLCITSSLVK